jgi:hypothetical protein
VLGVGSGTALSFRACALVLLAGRGFAAPFGLLEVGDFVTALGLLAGASDLTVRLLLRRSGRVVGSDPRTLGGGVSLITPVSPRA